MEIKLGCVAPLKCKLQEVFTLDLKVNLGKEGEERIFSEKFYLTVQAEAEEPDSSSSVSNSFSKFTKFAEILGSGHNNGGYLKVNWIWCGSFRIFGNVSTSVDFG